MCTSTSSEKAWEPARRSAWCEGRSMRSIRCESSLHGAKSHDFHGCQGCRCLIMVRRGSEVAQNGPSLALLFKNLLKVFEYAFALGDQAFLLRRYTAPRDAVQTRRPPG